MYEPVTKNAANPGDVQAAKQKEKRGHQRDIDDVKFLLSHRQGRRFFYRYLQQCGVFKTSFTGSSATFFNEGMRNIGLMLMADLDEADPSAYSKMVLEAKGEANV